VKGCLLSVELLSVFSLSATASACCTESGIVVAMVVSGAIGACEGSSWVSPLLASMLKFLVVGGKKKSLSARRRGSFYTFLVRQFGRFGAIHLRSGCPMSHTQAVEHLFRVRVKKVNGWLAGSDLRQCKRDF